LGIARDKVMIFGLSWFLIGLLPFLGILKLNSDMAEHWLYPASFGFFLMASILIVRNRLLKNKFALSVIILLLGVLAIHRNTAWRDDMSIYQDTLKYRQGDHRLHYNLGNAYLRRGVLDEASREYMLAMDINPYYAYAMNNLGVVLERKSDLEGACKFYKMANTITPGLNIARENLIRFSLVSPVFAGEEKQFDYSSYGEILAKFTKDGNVDYITLKKNIFSLDAFIKEISEMEPGTLNSMSRNDKIAFYINIYNALTLKVITDYYPIKSIKDIPGVWDKIKFRIAGNELTLNQIEHGILRKEFGEPRIHFALVCASQSCPKLAEEPFNGKDLNRQLEKGAGKFINGKTGAVLDKDNRVLYISSIFRWFGEDFGDAVQFISRYMSEEDAKFIRDVQPRVKYLRYDWSLNDK
jgi:tetratricopeptide (TPR) repeat protein